MPNFRKKPVVIEAREWTGANAVDLLEWIEPDAKQDGSSPRGSDTCAVYNLDPDFIGPLNPLTQGPARPRGDE